jgi:photosystem II stability/assembly factor-like uncharacterized protein
MRMNRLVAFLVCTMVLAAGAQSVGKTGPWELEESGSTAGLRGIHAVGRGVVWASGTGGTVLRSEDSGYLWQQCATPPGAGTLDFRGIWAWDAQNALVLSSGPGDQSRLYETTDGCSSWKLMITNPDATGFWDGILFLDRGHAVIYGDPVGGDPVGGDPVPGATRTHSVLPMRITLDGGTAWKVDGRSPQPLPGESIFAASNSAMTVQQGKTWLGTSKGRVLRSDSLTAWQGAQTPLASGNDSSGVFSVAFRDQKHGIAVGGDYRRPDEASGSAAYTSDGGEHWTAAHKPPHGYRSAVAWDAKDQVWITAGSNGSDMSYDDGATWQWLDGGNWNALSLPWAVGPNGQIGKLGMLPGRPAAAAGVSR